MQPPKPRKLQESGIGSFAMATDGGLVKRLRSVADPNHATMQQKVAQLAKFYSTAEEEVTQGPWFVSANAPPTLATDLTGIDARVSTRTCSQFDKDALHKRMIEAQRRVAALEKENTRLSTKLNRARQEALSAVDATTATSVVKAVKSGTPVDKGLQRILTALKAKLAISEETLAAKEAELDKLKGLQSKAHRTELEIENRKYFEEIRRLQFIFEELVASGVLAPAEGKQADANGGGSGGGDGADIDKTPADSFFIGLPGRNRKYWGQEPRGFVPTGEREMQTLEERSMLESQVEALQKRMADAEALAHDAVAESADLRRQLDAAIERNAMLRKKDLHGKANGDPQNNSNGTRKVAAVVRDCGCRCEGGTMHREERTAALQAHRQKLLDEKWKERAEDAEAIVEAQQARLRKLMLDLDAAERGVAKSKVGGDCSGGGSVVMKEMLLLDEDNRKLRSELKSANDAVAGYDLRIKEHSGEVESLKREIGKLRKMISKEKGCRESLEVELTEAKVTIEKLKLAVEYQRRLAAEDAERQRIEAEEARIRLEEKAAAEAAALLEIQQQEDARKEAEAEANRLLEEHLEKEAEQTRILEQQARERDLEEMRKFTAEQEEKDQRRKEMDAAALAREIEEEERIRREEAALEAAQAEAEAEAREEEAAAKRATIAAEEKASADEAAAIVAAERAAEEERARAAEEERARAAEEERARAAEEERARAEAEAIAARVAAEEVSARVAEEQDRARAEAAEATIGTDKDEAVTVVLEAEQQQEDERKMETGTVESDRAVTEVTTDEQGQMGSQVEGIQAPLAMSTGADAVATDAPRANDLFGDTDDDDNDGDVDIGFDGELSVSSGAGAAGHADELAVVAEPSKELDPDILDEEEGASDPSEISFNAESVVSAETGDDEAEADAFFAMQVPVVGSGTDVVAIDAAEGVVEEEEEEEGHGDASVFDENDIIEDDDNEDDGTDPFFN